MKLEIPQIIVILDFLNTDLAKGENPWYFYSNFPSYTQIFFQQLSPSEKKKLADKNFFCYNDNENLENKNPDDLDIVSYSQFGLISSRDDNENHDLSKTPNVLSEYSLGKMEKYIASEYLKYKGQHSDFNRKLQNVIIAFIEFEKLIPEQNILTNLFKTISNIDNYLFSILLSSLNMKETKLQHILANIEDTEAPLTQFKNINLRKKLISCLEEDIDNKNFFFLEKPAIIDFLCSPESIRKVSKNEILDIERIVNKLLDNHHYDYANQFIDRFYYLSKYKEDVTNIFSEEIKYSYLVPLNNSAIIKYIRNNNLQMFFPAPDDLYKEITILLNKSQLDNYSYDIVKSSPGLSSSTVEKDVQILASSVDIKVDSATVKKHINYAFDFIIECIQNQKDYKHSELFLEYTLLKTIPQNTHQTAVRKF